MKAQDNGMPTAFLDFIFICWFCFVFMFAVVFINREKEYKTEVDLLKRKSSKQLTNAKDGVEAPSITITTADGGGKTYVLESKTLGTKIFSDPVVLKAALERFRPAKIRLRIAKDVPTGVTQSVLLDLQDLGIMASLAVKQKM